MLDPNQIIEQFRRKQIDKDWSFCDYKQSETGKWSHSYHRYPAKFIPQLVEKLIGEYIPNSENAHVNDPFMGCGTTIVTAISKGLKASGTDINTLSFLISKVKSRPIDPDHLEKKVKQFLSDLSFLDPKQTLLFHSEVEPTIPQRHIDRINYWFTEEFRLELGQILTVIYREHDPIVKDFFLVAFSNILKNCSIWLKSSTKPTRDLKKSPTKPFEAIKRHLTKMVRGNTAFYWEVPQHVRNDVDAFLNIKNSDARNQPVYNNTVDLIISSSPYVTSYEYADLHQLSTIWLDLTDDLKAYRREFIGTSHKQYSDKKLKSQIATQIVHEMSPKSAKKSREIEAFFVDMHEVFDESFRVLKRGGRCCYVIGNTQLKGIDILNAEAFAESLQHSGFRLDRIIKREIPLKILPQKRDKKTGRFASSKGADSEAYPTEYIVIGLKE